MVRMERVWNTVAVGGVLGALLTTAGVVNLGNLPSWSSSASTPTGSLAVAAEPAEMPAVTLASVTPGEQQPLPELPIVNAAFETPEVSSEPAPLRATLTTPDGPSPALRLHDEIKATLLTTTDAYAYCYYADGAGSISRIFPNRFAPSPLVRTGALELTRAFSLVADKPNRTEEVRCIAATKDLGSKLPGELQAEDLVTPAGCLAERDQRHVPQPEPGRGRDPPRGPGAARPAHALGRARHVQGSQLLTIGSDLVRPQGLGSCRVRQHACRR